MTRTGTPDTSCTYLSEECIRLPARDECLNANCVIFFFLNFAIFFPVIVHAHDAILGLLSVVAAKLG